MPASLHSASTPMPARKRRGGRPERYEESYFYLLENTPRLTRPPQAIPPELQKKSRATAIATDVDDGTGPDEDLPEASAAGVLDVAKDADGNKVADADPEAGEPPFARTGWAPKFGAVGEKVEEEESLLDHATWVEGKLPDTLYGGK